MQSDTVARLTNEVELATGEFLAQIVALSRQAVTESLSSAFRRGGAGGSATVARAPAPKRSTAQIEQTGRTFALFVRDNPGMRIEQINRELGTTTDELMLPIRKLIAAGAVATQGGRRSTKYFPGKEFVRRILDAKKADATGAAATLPPADPAPTEVAPEKAAPAKAAPAKATKVRAPSVPGERSTRQGPRRRATPSRRRDGKKK